MMPDILLEFTRLLLAIFVIRSPEIECRWLAGFVHSWLVNFSARWKEQLSFLFSDFDMASFYATVVEKGKQTRNIVQREGSKQPMIYIVQYFGTA